MINEADDFIRQYLRAVVGPQQSLLDVGCGPAPYRHLIAGRYVGIDKTEAAYGAAPRRTDVVADGESLPFRSDCFDAVFSKSAFYQIPDPTAALSEFRRVLKPGGRLLLIDYNRRTQRRLQEAEGIARPGWTQWQLRRLVARAGFHDCNLLVAKAGGLSWLERRLRLLLQEFVGTWAIVSAGK
jgi:ubiquinone/menaquinone biosynthesis C-methylase UbiE